MENPFAEVFNLALNEMINLAGKITPEAVGYIILISIITLILPPQI